MEAVGAVLRRGWLCGIGNLCARVSAECVTVRHKPSFFIVILKNVHFVCVSFLSREVFDSSLYGVRQLPFSCFSSFLP